MWYEHFSVCFYLFIYLFAFIGDQFTMSFHGETVLPHLKFKIQENWDLSTVFVNNMNKIDYFLEQCVTIESLTFSIYTTL